MRVLRPAGLIALAAIFLFIPACSLGPIQQVSIGTARLGPEGATVDTSIKVKCQTGYNVAFGDVFIAQSSGSRLARGFGGFTNDFPGIPCTGRAQTFAVTVFNDSPWVFRRGSASADAFLTVYNPVTGELISEGTGPEEITIRRALAQSSTAPKAEPPQQNQDAYPKG